MFYRAAVSPGRTALQTFLFPSITTTTAASRLIHPSRSQLSRLSNSPSICARAFTASTHSSHSNKTWADRSLSPSSIHIGSINGFQVGVRTRDAPSRFTSPFGAAQRRNRHDSGSGSDKSPLKDGEKDSSETTKIPDPNTRAAKESAGPLASGKYLFDRLSHIQRPTKEDLLAAATGFWHRLAIRFKWFSIRSTRPFNSDDIGAFLSWIFWGHALWLVIGTTTFVSLAIWAVNTVFAQETLAGIVGNYLTKSSGIKIVFESAIVPTWKDGVITFNNVFVSRRPGQTKKDRTVSKGSSQTAAALAAAQKTKDNVPEDDGNYTQFDLTVDTVNVTLSFTKWFNGRGLLHNVEIRGVRGVIDRTSVFPTGEKRDPKSYRHTHKTGDFEIESFKMDDVLVTIYQPKNFRPFTVSIFNCELPRLRKQWLFYDFMCANTLTGAFDDSLFTIHPRQVHMQTGVTLVDGMDQSDPTQWKKHSRLRVDGLKIDHLNRGVNGPFSWIHEGNVDIIADVMIPTDPDASIVKVMSDFYERMEASVSSSHARRATPLDTNALHEAQDDEAGNISITNTKQDLEDTRYVVFDIRVHLNDVRATVPLFTQDLSYVSNAFVRPIVAYINSRRAFIPVNCRVVKRQNEFDGSWTIFDSGLLADLSRETYQAFARDITDQQQRNRRIKKVGYWTLQLAAQALFLGLAGQLA